MNLSATVQKINYWITLAVVFLTPVFFLPITSEFYEFNKQALLIIAALISFVLWAVSCVNDRQVRVVRSPLGLPILFTVVTWVLSAALRTPNKYDAFFEPGQVGTIIALGLLFFTAINTIRTKKQVENLVGTALASTGLLAVITILWSSGLFAKIIPVAYMQTPVWTPTGNAITTLTVLVLTLVFSAILLFKGKSQITTSKKTALSVVLGLLIIGSGLMAFRLFFTSDNRPVFLSQSASWSIALEALKTSPILGTGPATYLSDFTRFRPASYNLTDTWAIRFASSSNYYLQLLSTVGILGFGVYLLIVIRSFKFFTKAFNTTAESTLHSVAVASSATLMLAFIAQLFVPVSFVYLAMVFFLIIITTVAFKLLGSSLVHEANVDIVAASETGGRSPILPWVALLASVALLLPSLYFAGRIYAAEMQFQHALMLASQNDGRATYETIKKSISIFPYKDSYHIAAANVNLLLANAIASGKKELSAQERDTITQLIQDAIREAKNGVALNPNKVTNVESLAGVYRQLLTLAKGADTWTVAAYQRAIELDPSNPNLRIALGGVLYSLKSYDEAIRVFQTAADLKPDLANAYYNIAAAYKEKGDFGRAYTNMQTVVNQVKKDSADYTKALAELEELRTKVSDKNANTTPEAPAQTNLNKPEALPTPKAQIQLPADLGPDVSGTPAPSPLPTKPATSTTPAPTTTPAR